MRADIDPRFASYASAQQRHLLHLAELITVDPETASRATEATLARLARTWDDLDDQDPADWVRIDLVHAATSAEQTATPGLVRGGWDERDPDQTRRTATALRALPPQQRALLALLGIDDRSVPQAAALLRIRPEQAVAATEQALAAMREAGVDIAGDPAGAVASGELGQLLDRVGRVGADHDLVSGAWSAARAAERRSRRHTLLAAAVAVVVLVGGLAWRVSVGGNSVAAATPTPSSATGFSSAEAADDGTPVIRASTAQAYDRLPVLPTDLPGTLGWTGELPTVDAVLADLPRDQRRIVAAFAEDSLFGSFRPVVLLSGGGAPRYATDNRQPFHAPDSIGPLSASAISPDGTQVAYRVDGGVAVLDVRSGWSTVTVPVDDGSDQVSQLDEVGFAADGTLVARSQWTAWVVDTATSQARLTDSTTWPAAARLILMEGTPTLVRHQANGAVFGSAYTRLPMASMSGDSVAGADWVAAAGAVDKQKLADVADQPAVFVVATKNPDVRRMFVLSPGEAAWALAWRGDTVVVDSSSPLPLAATSNSHPGRPSQDLLIGLNVRTGQVGRVSTLISSPGWTNGPGTLALSPPAGTGR